jgi:FMN phosphatase YigB (HAD superfamily)
MSRFKAIVLDLGNVVFEWSTPSPEVGATMRTLMKSSTWFQFECGLISTEQCYRDLGEQFDLQSSEIQSIFHQAFGTLQVNTALVDLIRDLKKKNNLAVYAMSNISRGHIDELSSSWSQYLNIFEQIFSSGYAGMRKPDLPFYQHVFDEIKLSPDQLLFVDDKLTNLEPAQGLGVHGIRFTTTAEVCQLLVELVDHRKPLV